MYFADKSDADYHVYIRIRMGSKGNNMLNTGIASSTKPIRMLKSCASQFSAKDGIEKDSNIESKLYTEQPL